MTSCVGLPQKTKRLYQEDKILLVQPLFLLCNSLFNSTHVPNYYS